MAQNYARLGLVTGLATGLMLAEDSAGQAPMGPLRGLHGSGPFGLMRAADLDRDGREELLVEDGRGHLVLIEPRLRTQERVPERVISLAYADLRDLAVGDLDRNGTLEIVSVGDDVIRWHQRAQAGDPGGGGQVTAGWDTHELAASAQVGVVALGDVDRDGDLDCLTADPTGLDLLWYRNDTPDESVAFAPSITIAIGARVVSLAVVDVNADGWLDALSLSAQGLGVHLRDVGLDSFTSAFVDVGMADARHLRVHDADGDADVDVLVVGDDGASLAVNADGLGGAWTVSDIASGLLTPRRGFVSDMDDDGGVDYVSECDGQAITWLPDASGVGAVMYNLAVRGYGPTAVFDMDGDGDDDVVGALTTGPLLWRENLVIHRSVVLGDRADIEIEVNGAFNITSGDLDGDGDADFAAAAFNDDVISWHENLGGGVFLAHEVLAGTNGPVSVICADLDMDGRLDLASASTNDSTIHWHRNLGGVPPTFETRVVSTDAGGVFSISAGDLDRDGRIDLVSAEKNVDRVRWFRNQDVNGAVEFTAGLVKNGVRGAFHVHVADVDGDAWPDVLSASRDDDSVRLLRNLGGDLSSCQTIVLTTRAGGAACVHSADMDGDGDIDVVSASRDDGGVRWFENDGASPPAFFERTIDSAVPGATWVRAADLDGDGDFDLACAARENGVTYTYINDGGAVPSFARRGLGEPADMVSCVEPADVDADGRVDLAIAAVSVDLLAWYRNEGGAFALNASSIAPETVPAWGVAGVLQLDTTNRARAGGSEIDFLSVSLRFEDDEQQALTTEQLARLVQRLSLHEDDGNGEFDPVLDLELTGLETVELLDGVFEFDVPESARVLAAGQTRRLFFVLRMAEGAGTQDPHGFAVFITGHGAVHGHNGSAIWLEDDRVVGTPIIQATCPADMTTTDDPDDPNYGVPDGVIDQMDFSFYTMLYDAMDPGADLTSTNDRSDPMYAIPDGVVDSQDQFFYLDRYSEGC